MTTAARRARSERSRATQRRVVAAATELFIRDGYLDTTVTAIAKQAGVAVQTLYLSFGSKDALLAAALDVAIAGDDEPMPILERPWFSQMRDEPDGRQTLAVFVAMAADVVARVEPLYDVVQRASADVQVGDLLERTKRQRRETFAASVQLLVGKAGFGAGLSADRATSVLYALLSEECYRLLVVEEGWSQAEWRDWVERTAAAQLFPGDRDTATSRPRSDADS
jgi:AcrR family transcriptional regulator